MTSLTLVYLRPLFVLNRPEINSRSGNRLILRLRFQM